MALDEGAHSPERPPPRPCPRLLCKMKNGLARSDTHSAPASNTSSGWIHISVRSLLTVRRDPSTRGKLRDVVFAQSADCTSLPGLRSEHAPEGCCVIASHKSRSSSSTFKIQKIRRPMKRIAIRTMARLPDVFVNFYLADIYSADSPPFPKKGSTTSCLRLWSLEPRDVRSADVRTSRTETGTEHVNNKAIFVIFSSFI